MWIEDKRLTRQLRCSFREKTAHRGSVLGRNVILWMDWWRRQVVRGLDYKWGRRRRAHCTTTSKASEMRLGGISFAT